jgi:glycosyltransferase involved in cell wall biosynthesis
MPRALLLSYYTPPRPGVATARTRQLMRYLPEFGWDVTIVTAALDGAHPSVVQTPYVDMQAALKRAVGIRSASAHAALGVEPATRGSRRTWKQQLIAWGYRLTSYPDAQVGWFPGARSSLRSLLAQGTYDALISTSPPNTTELAIASIRPRIPWIADYRDLWAENTAYASPILHWSDRALARVLGRLCPNLPVDVIPNAYDPEEWESIPFERAPRCTIVHAGQMFNGRRDPRPLFRVLRALIGRGAIQEEEVCVEIFAPREAWLDAMIEEFGLCRVVEVKGTRPRAEVLMAERRADRLLILLWDG